MMAPGLDLHGMDFVALHVMEDNQVFLVGSFQSVGIAQLSIDPYRQVCLGEFVVHFNV